MKLLLWKACPLIPMFAQSAYERGRAVGQLLGLIFAIAIAVWAYRKFAGGQTSKVKSKQSAKKRRRQ